jgi:hypothetical protein
MREAIPSLRKMLQRWKSIVRGLRNSCAATSRGPPFGDEADDLDLLRGELVERVGVAPPC